MKYIVRYEYLSPGHAGPFKGRLEVGVKHVVGDEIAAPFGRAVITSCRKVKQTLIVPPNYELILGVSKVEVV